VKPIVLVVEDEDDSRESLRDVLELAGYRVHTAANGQEALDQLGELADQPCIVMLLDLFMPVMDGWQVVDQLRTAGRLDKIKILVTTSAAHRAPGGVPVFQKPLSLPKLLRAVEAAC
jgi:CheY-like chemotaxis protein